MSLIEPDSKLDLIYGMSESVVLPSFSDTGNGELFIGKSPLKLRGRAVYRGMSYTDAEGNITGLNVLDESVLFLEIKRRTGFRISSMGLYLQSCAIFSDFMSDYRRNVLMGHSVHTGQVVVKKGDDFFVSYSLLANQDDYEKVCNTIRNLDSSETGQVDFDFPCHRRRSYRIPKNNGYINKTSSLLSKGLPEDGDLGEKDIGFEKDGIGSLGYFSSIIFDDYGLSSIKSSWGECMDTMFSYGARTTENFHFNTVIGVSSRDNPRK